MKKVFGILYFAFAVLAAIWFFMNGDISFVGPSAAVIGRIIGTPKDAKPLYDMLCGLIN